MKLSVAIILTLNIIALILCQAIQTVSYDENAVFLYAWKKINVFKFKELRNTLFIGYLVPIFFGILYLIDFQGAFVKFHEIFFKNDLWQLDPKTDLLIRLMPEEFFVSGFIKILAYYTISIFVIHICSFYYVARCSSKMKKKEV